MSNEHWTAAARRRLSILTRPEDAQSCALPTGQEDEKCGAPLDRHVRHAQCCNAGPAHKRTHKALAAALRPHHLAGKLALGRPHHLAGELARLPCGRHCAQSARRQIPCSQRAGGRGR